MATYLTNARIYTLDTRQPLADSMSIEAGKITAVGRAAEILPDPRGLAVEDLQGRTVIAGLCDAHIHMLEYGLSLARVDCETSTRAECLQRLKARLADTPAGAWVRGHGWNHNIWPEGMGSKRELDAIFPRNPVYLTHKSLHSAWANSAALLAAGIGAGTPDPPNGHIQREADGKPSGILLENAMQLVEEVIPPPNADAIKAALLMCQEALLRFGITSAHDFDKWVCWQALRDLEENGKLRLRVVKNIPVAHLEEAIALGLRSGQGSERLRAGWVKMFADGALGPQTAAMLEPYEGSDNRGMLFLNSQQIMEKVLQAQKVGIHPTFHAIGDHANREVLDGYEELAARGLLGKGGLPPRIEHVQLIHPLDLARLAALGVTASMQPIHAISDRVMAERYWGARCAQAYAWRSLLECGTRIIFGSDAPVESPNPFWGLHAAVTRQPIDAQPPVAPWHAEQCLDLTQAVRAYTTQLAEGKFGDWLSARISVGERADLAVLPVDIFREDARALVECLPSAVMAGGEWVYSER